MKISSQILWLTLDRNSNNASLIRECKPGLYFSNPGLWVWRPPNPGTHVPELMIMSVRRVAASYCRPTVSGHLSEADSRGCKPWTVSRTTRRLAVRWLMEVAEVKTAWAHKHMRLCTLHKNCNPCPFSFMSNRPTIIVAKWVQLQHDQQSRPVVNGLCWLTNCQLYHLCKHRPTCTMHIRGVGLISRVRPIPQFTDTYNTDTFGLLRYRYRVPIPILGVIWWQR